MKRAQRSFVLLLVVAWLGLSPAAHAERRTVRGGSLMNLGIGMLIGNGTTAPGVGISFSTHITNAPVFIGLDTGSYFVASPFSWIIPALLMVKYDFRNFGILTPTIGLSLGPTLGLGNVQNTMTFAMFFKPGLQIALTREIDFVVEPRLGVIGSNFYFDPEINVQFNL